MVLALSPCTVQICEDINHHGINIYPRAYEAEDPEEALMNDKYNVGN